MITVTWHSQSHFNPHSREGSDKRCKEYYLQHYDFNPHSREGSDTGVEEKLEGYAISIHTPAKGVTSIRIDFGDGTAISIHTPAKGVTKSQISTIASQQISIHTPAKGVTQTLHYKAVCRDHFNPHSREGSDSNFA